MVDMQNEDKAYDSNKKIGDLISSTIESMDLGEDYLSGKLRKHWPEIVGEAISRNVEFFRLKKGEITLLTSSSAWRFELFSKKEEIIGMCNEFLSIEAVQTMKIR